MTEGRKCQVMLQDERRLHFLIQPKLLTSDLMDMVSSHFTLKEKEYFGLAFQDESGHYNWLQLDRRVLEHDYPKKTGPLLLHFQVKFFIESIAYLRDNATIEVFYLQAKQSIHKGTVEADSDTIFELAAHVLQESHGNYMDDESTRHDLKKLPVLPMKTLKEHPSLSRCEDEIITHYKKLSGLSRGSAIVNYMTIAESLPTYGIHSYEVKDKSGLPWWIGLSYKGIAQYDYTDKRIPRRVFPWKQLENLYFRDKKFSIEVLDPKRVSVSRRTFGPSNVNVFAWFTSTPQLTKCIWSMAVSQHQFYLDRKQSKSHLPAVRSMSEIAADLCHSTPSLHSSGAGTDNLSQCSSTASLQHYSGGTLPRKQSDVTADDLEEIKAAQKEMYQALMTRKEALEATLKKKTEELKKICLKEAEITGELPKETPLVPGEPLPLVRRKMGTAFSLSPKVVDREHRSQDEEYVSKLELEYELQKQICHAAQKLAQDSRLNKKARKQRKTQYINAHLKLKNLEKKLKEAIEHARRFRTHSQDDLDHIPITDSETEFTPGQSPALGRRGTQNDSKSSLDSELPSRPCTLVQDGTVPSTSSSQCSLPDYTSPHSPAKQLSRESSPSPNRPVAVGYMPSSVYTTRTQYRNQTYPTFSIRSHSLSSTHSDYDSTGSMNRDGSRTDVGCSRTDLENQPYYTEGRSGLQGESKAPVINPYVTVNSDHDYRYIYDEERLQNIGRTGSLDKVFRRRRSSVESRTSDERRYGSLERNFTYNRANAGVGNPEYVGQYEITHAEEGDHDYEWYHTSVPQHVTDVTRSPSRQINASGDAQRPRFYIDEPEYTVQGEAFTTVHEYPHFREESKPFEMADFYQYSEKLRKQRLVDMKSDDRVQTSSPALSQTSSTSSDRTDRTSCVPQYAHSVRVGNLDYAYPVQQPTYAGPVQQPTYAPPGHYATSTTTGVSSAQYGNPQLLGVKAVRSPYQSPQTGRSQRAYPAAHQPQRCQPVDDDRPSTPSDRVAALADSSCHSTPASTTGGDTSFNLEPCRDLAATFSKEMYAWYESDTWQEQDEQTSMSSSLV